MISSTKIYVPNSHTEKYFIRNIWSVNELDTCERIETILPKGNAEIILNNSDKIVYLSPEINTPQVLPACFINGVNFKPVKLIKNGQQQFIGIQLNPIGLKVLFNISVKEFNNKVIDGSSICSSLNTLRNIVFSKNSFEEQVYLIRKWIHYRIAVSKFYHKLIEVNELFFSKQLNETTVRELCINNHLSERHMRRIAGEWLGMKTETFISYNKYLTALHLMHNSTKNLTQIGMEAGYFDQSHFIREFKSFADITPKEYKASYYSVPGHIISNV